MRKFFSVCFLFLIYQSCFVGCSAVDPKKQSQGSQEYTTLLSEGRVVFRPMEIKIMRNLSKNLGTEDKKEVLSKLQGLDMDKFGCILFGMRKDLPKCESLPEGYLRMRRDEFLSKTLDYARLVRDKLVSKLVSLTADKQEKAISPLDVEDIYMHAKCKRGSNGKANQEMVVDMDGCATAQERDKFRIVHREDEEIVDDYTNNYFYQINGILRGKLFACGNPYAKGRDNEDIMTLAQCLCDSKKLVEVLNRQSIDSNIKKLFRGMSEESLKCMLTEKTEGEIQVGQSFVDKGCTSTSEDIEVAEKFAIDDLRDGKKPLIIVFDTSERLPLGRSVCGKKFKDLESEVLLAPNQEFRITEKWDGQVNFAFKNYPVKFIKVVAVPKT